MVSGFILCKNNLYRSLTYIDPRYTIDVSISTADISTIGIARRWYYFQ